MKNFGKNLRDWYKGSSIPSSYYDYAPWIAGASGLLSVMIKSKTGREIPIVFIEGVDTACVMYDSGKPKVVIGKGVFEPSYTSEINASFTGYKFLAAILGYITHEASHILWTPAETIPEMFKDTRVEEPNQIQSHIANVVEDIYIENRFVETFSMLEWTTEAAWEFLFPESTFKANAKAWDGSKPAILDDVVMITNAMTACKNQLRAQGFADKLKPWGYTLYEMFMSSKSQPTVQDRANLALDIYDYIVEALPKEKQEELQEKLSTEESARNALDKMVESLEELLEELEEAFAKEAWATNSGVSDGRLAEITEKFMSSTFDVANVDKVQVVEFIPSTAQKAGMFGFDPFKGMYGGEDVLTYDVDTRWQKLVEVAKAKAAGKPQAVIASNRGKRFKHLSRISTDGKVFGKAVGESRNRGNAKLLHGKEIIILVDCSGSMNGPKITSAMAAAHGAALGLLAAKHHVAVYGHTGDDRAGHQAIIFKIKGFNDPIEVMEQEIKAILDHKLLWNNYDGIAVEYVANKFTGRTESKHMIVISDGAPAANGYAGNSAIEDSRMRVEKARKKGVNITSISIERSCVSTNNLIYGSKYNTFNNDPNAISDIVKMLF